LVEELYSSFKANVFRVTPMNANGTVRLLKDLGRTKQATELIEFYLDQRGKAIFDRTQHFDENDISEPEFRKAFDARVAAIEDHRDPATVLQAIAENRGWNREDVSLLATLSADDFYAIFKKINGEQLSPMVRRALAFDGEEEKIAKAATDALLKIAAESELNKRRVQKFGIKVP
jgi:hypothetical protein